MSFLDVVSLFCLTKQQNSPLLYQSAETTGVIILSPLCGTTHGNFSRYHCTQMLFKLKFWSYLTNCTKKTLWHEHKNQRRLTGRLL